MSTRAIRLFVACCLCVAITAHADWVELDKILAGDAAAGDEFGYSVSVDGDTAVVGTHGDNGDAGSAYIFGLVTGSWVQQAKLTASDAASGDRFGRSVSLSGGTAIVGAWLDDDNGSGSGSAYVFEKPGGGWAGSLTESAKLTASDGSVLDHFGYSVAISGSTAVVGAHADNSSAGAGYVFVEPGGGWAGSLTESAKLTASDAASSDLLGVSSSISGDTVVLGALGVDDNGSDSGSAYVFEKPGGGWAGSLTESAKLIASDGAVGDGLGISVGVSGDTVVVGAHNDDDGGNKSGSAYIFEKPGGGWTGTLNESAKLAASDGTNNDFLGYSVGMSGDTAIVGAYGENEEGSGAGSAYVFDEPGGGWTGTVTETQKLTASDGSNNDAFAWSVGIGGDAIIAGAPFNDDGGNSSGSAYIFGPETTSDCPNLDLTLQGTSPPTTHTVNGGIGLDDSLGIFRINPDAPTGTGVFDTFVQVQALGSEVTEKGYNTLGERYYSEGSSDIHNHEIQLLQIPIVTVESVDYFQFLLDVNEEKEAGKVFLSLDEFKLYVNPMPFVNPTHPTAPDPSLLGAPRYDMDSKTDVSVLLNQGVVSGGSGKGDYEVLVPVSTFADAGDAPADYLYLWSAFGFLPTGSCPYPELEWIAGDGFEEWGVKEYDEPVFYGGGGFDFGDLPDSYDTLLEDGPRHADGTFERLGKEWDAETDGNPSLNATGDDWTGIDDEDGVMFVDGGVYIVPTVGDWEDTTRYNDDPGGVGHIFVDGWLDLNQDGNFGDEFGEDLGEHIVAYEANPNGWGANSPDALFFAIADWVPGFGPAGTGYYSRFRISYGAATTWFGESAFGEVEDYWVAPEPATLSILGVGLVVAYRRRRRR